MDATNKTTRLRARETSPTIEILIYANDDDDDDDNDDNDDDHDY